MQNQLGRIDTWGDAFMLSLTNALALMLSAIPRILGFAIILVIGWLIASILAKVVGALLRAVHFNDLARQSGFGDFVQKMGVKTGSAGVIAETSKWFVRLVALVVAFDALGLPAVSDVLRQLLLWLPNLVVALVVLVVGGIAANTRFSLVRGATAKAGFTNPDTLATVARVAVWAFAMVVAVNQLGIAPTLINTLLIGVVGALALGSGLAFGLGGREVAGEIVRGWQQQAAAAPKVARAAETLKQQAGERLPIAR